MYRKLTNIIFLLLLVSLMACREAEDNVAAPGGKVAVSFAAGILTRVVDTGWETGDNIGINMLASGLSEITGETFNRQYQVSGPGVLSVFLPQSPEETIYFPVDGTKVDFLAYYPFINGLKSLKEYPVSIADQANWQKIDLLLAKTENVDRNSPDVELDFHHQLVSLEFTIRPGDTDTATVLAGAVLKIKNISVKANCDLYTGTFESLDNGDVTARMSPDGTKGEAIVMPRQPGREIWLEITLANRTSYSAYIGTESYWESGTCYAYTITLRKKPVPVDISVTITDWVRGSEQGKLE